MLKPRNTVGMARLRDYTPSRVDLGRSGASLPTRALLDFQLAHAKARDAVHLPLAVTSLAVELKQMRKLADDIGALGLSPAEGRGSNQAWATSTPEDPNLVNDAGESDPYWLYDVIESLPPQR